MAVSDDIRRQLLDDFRSETQQRVDRVNLTWIAIEKAPDDAETLRELLRELHTIKGSAKMMGFVDVSLVSHRAESIVVAARDAGKLDEPSVGDLVLAAADAISHLIQKTAGRPQPSLDLSVLMQRFDATQGELDGGPPAEAATRSPPPVPAEKPTSDELPPENETGEATALPSEKVGSPQASFDSLQVSQALVASFSEAAGDVVVAQSRYEYTLGGIREQVADALMQLGPQSGGAAPDHAGAAVVAKQALQSVHEQLGLLSELTYAGSVLARSLDRKAYDLRLVPVGRLFERHARPVRDLGREQGKQIQVQVRDNGVRIENGIVGKLGEPLLHLLRNSVDHGLETPEERVAADKPPTGTITLSATVDRGSAVIIISDDGRGIDLSKVRRRADELGCLPDDDGSAQADDALLDLIFSPGFSTRDEVSQISGRGVGLDVVRRQLVGLGGSVAVQSRSASQRAAGAGARFELRVPISTTLTRVLTVKIGDAFFAIPSRAIETVFEVDQAVLQIVQGKQAIVVGERIIPVVGLNGVVGHEAGNEIPTHLVVVAHEAVSVALLTSRWHSEYDAVVKPLGAMLDSNRLVSGVGILESGGLALVLSPAELVARISTTVRATPGPQRDRAAKKRVSRRILVVEDSTITRMMVSRILRAAGHQAFEAGNGSLALEVLDSEEVDLILTDLDMPVMNGIELVRRLRQDGQKQHIPIVVLSSRGTDEDKMRCLEAGADDYLVKSDFSEASLMRVVDRQLGG